MLFRAARRSQARRLIDHLVKFYDLEQSTNIKVQMIPIMALRHKRKKRCDCAISTSLKFGFNQHVWKVSEITEFLKFDFDMQIDAFT
ncbi:Uncharacterized protein ACO02O_08959 [Dirofilaria immitis]